MKTNVVFVHLSKHMLTLKLDHLLPKRWQQILGKGLVSTEAEETNEEVSNGLSHRGKLLEVGRIDRGGGYSDNATPVKCM